MASTAAQDILHGPRIWIDYDRAWPFVSLKVPLDGAVLIRQSANYSSQIIKRPL